MTCQPDELEQNAYLSLFEGKLAQFPTAIVPVRSLLSPDSPRLEGEDDAYVHLLADSEAEFPPLIVHRDTMRVIDGAHRLRAATLRGAVEIEVRYFDGSNADAFVLAVEANVAHGMPLSRADRKAAAKRIIVSHPQLSDRAIASVTGLAAKTVGTIRRCAAGDIPPLRTRVGRDGRARPLDTAGGRRRAMNLMRENPTASLRQIAAKAGVSQGTARDVRDRLARGESPVPTRRRRTSKPKEQDPPGDVSERRSLAAGGSPEYRTLLLERLKQDPSLRFTETGRRLLRLFDIHTRSELEWAQLLENVPAHCRGTVEELVRGCAEMWQEMALRLDQDRQAGAS